MYTIGQFSKIGRVSTKMLRHYDKIGLLKPSIKSVENGYRYYSSSQVRDILFICKLKAYKLSLEDIKRFMDNREPQLLQELLQSKHQELEQEIASNQFLLLEINKEINYLSKGVDIMSKTRTFNFSVKEMPEITVLSKRDTISMENISSLVGKVFEDIFKNGLKPAGPIMTFYYVQEDFDPEDADVEVCVPVDRELKTDSISTRELKGGLYATTTFVGPYHEISEAYAAIGVWMNEQGYEVIGAPYEKYITDPSTGISPSEYITELYFPIRE